MHVDRESAYLKQTNTYTSFSMFVAEFAALSLRTWPRENYLITMNRCTDIAANDAPDANAPICVKMLRT